MTPIRILLAEDHNLVRAGIRALLSNFEDFDVVAEANNGHGRSG
jgi:DNA-binding NarL/FixJ family response regulator